MTYKGIWFYGLSGSGKTYITNQISKKIKNSFIIDGDKVRKLISSDLSYSLSDRKISNKRALGLAKITISNKYFPIISSAYLDPKICSKAKKIKIKVIEVVRKSSEVGKKLKGKKNIVGKSIKQPNLKTKIYINSMKHKKINLTSLIN